MHLISPARNTLSKQSGVSRSRHKSLRSCCSMSAIAVTLFNRMQKIHNSVCNLHRLSGRCEHAVLGKRMLKNIGGQVNKQIEDFRIALLELRNAFLDHATITTEITALQILDDVGIISANVGSISSQVDGLATRLKWVSRQVSDAGTLS